eukprot:5608476-Alexandrium_andersonii.AAC.1
MSPARALLNCCAPCRAMGARRTVAGTLASCLANREHTLPSDEPPTSGRIRPTHSSRTEGPGSTPLSSHRYSPCSCFGAASQCVDTELPWSCPQQCALFFTRV